MMATDLVGKGTQIKRGMRERLMQRPRQENNLSAIQEQPKGKKHSRKGKPGFKAWDCLIVTSLT